MASKADESLATASGLVSEGHYGRAFAHFLLAIALDQSIKEREGVEESFVDCLNSWSAQLVSLQRGKDAAWCFEQACDVWPQSRHVLHATGQFFFQSGFRREGLSFLEKACHDIKSRPDWIWDLQNAASSLVERWHFRMLNDKARNRAYQDALKRAVDQGHQRILDIGSGTGILSMLSVSAGARHVTACEMDPVMSDLSKLIIEKNGMEKNINVKNVKSTDLHMESKDDRFSLVVTEIADAGLLGEGIIPTLEHAWKNLLQPRDQTSQGELPSQVIPAGATVYVQIIESRYIRRQHRLVMERSPIGPWSMPVVRSRCAPTTFRPDEQSSGSDTEPYTSEILSQIPRGWQPISTPLKVYQFNFCDPEILSEDHLTEKTVSIPVTISGHADAVVSWFELHLDSQSTVSSSPTSGSCWEQAVYPIHQDQQDGPLQVGLGDLVDVSCRCHPTWMSFNFKAVRRREERAEYVGADVSVNSPPEGDGGLEMTIKQAVPLSANSCPKWNNNGFNAVKQGMELNEGDSNISGRGLTQHFADIQSNYTSRLHERTEACGVVAGQGCLQNGDEGASAVDCSVNHPSRPLEGHGDNRLKRVGHTDECGQTCPGTSSQEAALLSGGGCTHHPSSQMHMSANHRKVKARNSDNRNCPDTQSEKHGEGDGRPVVHKAELGQVSPRASPCNAAPHDSETMNRHEVACSSLGCEQNQGILRISSEDLSLLNDTTYLEFIRASLVHYAQETCHPTEGMPVDHEATEGGSGIILDMTGAGLVGLLGRGMVIPRGHVVHVTSDGGKGQFVDEIIRRNKKSLGNYKHVTGRGGADEGMNNNIRMVVSDLVDSSGILKENSLEDVHLACARSSFHEACVIPEVLSIHAVCIESEELDRNTRVTGTDPTLGLDVSLINEYKTSTQLEVCLPKLPHRKLTEQFVAFDFNLGQLGKSRRPAEVFTQERDLTIQAIDTGRISSVVYWFEMSSRKGDAISTLEEDTHWLQAAFMMDRNTTVQRGDRIKVSSYLRNGVLSFAVV